MPDSITAVDPQAITQGSSASESTEVIASGEQNQDTVESLKEKYEKAQRHAETYRGNAENLRTREQALQSTVDQLTARQTDLLNKFEALEESSKSNKINAAIEQLRADGHSEQEIQMAKALVQEQQRLDKAKKALDDREASLRPAARDLEIRTYITKSLDRANTRLAARGVDKPISEAELKKVLKGEPKEQQDIEDAVQDLILQRTDELINKGRTAKLEDRAKAGIDPSPKGGKTVGTLHEAEQALRRGDMTPKEFGKFAVQARKDGVVGYR